MGLCRLIDGVADFAATIPYDLLQRPERRGWAYRHPSCRPIVVCSGPHGPLRPKLTIGRHLIYLMRAAGEGWLERSMFPQSSCTKITTPHPESLQLKTVLKILLRRKISLKKIVSVVSVSSFRRCMTSVDQSVWLRTANIVKPVSSRAVYRDCVFCSISNQEWQIKDWPWCTSLRSESSPGMEIVSKDWNRT